MRVVLYIQSSSFRKAKVSLRIFYRILVLGNGGIKKSRSYNEDEELNGYVLTLQKFERLVREGEKNGTILITTNTIETDENYNI